MTDEEHAHADRAELARVRARNLADLLDDACRDGVNVPSALHANSRARLDELLEVKGAPVEVVACERAAREPERARHACGARVSCSVHGHMRAGM